MKGFFLIIFALFIDGITAAIGLGIFVISIFPGTVAGATAGCITGQQVAGSLGCQIGAVILGFLGTLPVINATLAAATVPAGAALGFVIGLSLNITLGGGLIILLIFNGMFYPKYMFGGIIELIPGVSVLPFWTALVIASSIKHYSDKKKVSAEQAGALMGSIVSPGSVVGVGVSAVVGIQQQNMALARRGAPQSFEPLQEQARNREENETDESKRAANQVIRDIRPRQI